MTAPTYQQLIELLDEAEKLEPESSLSVAEILTTNFSIAHPDIKIGRPKRFLETVSRISAPVKKGKLETTHLMSYLQREWIPRVRNEGVSQSEGRLLSVSKSEVYMHEIMLLIVHAEYNKL